MAQLNITLNQEEILQLLSADRDEAFRTMLQNSLNSILKVESQDQLQATPYERSEKRTDSRNGSRERDLNTRIGRITLTVPRHRNQPFDQEHQNQEFQLDDRFHLFAHPQRGEQTRDLGARDGSGGGQRVHAGRLPRTVAFLDPLHGAERDRSPDIPRPERRRLDDRHQLPGA